MVQVERQQLGFERRQWLPGRYILEPEVLHPDSPHLHFVSQGGHGITAIVPDTAQRVSGANCPGVTIIDIEHAFSQALAHQFVEFGFFIRVNWKVRI